MARERVRPPRFRARSFAIYYGYGPLPGLAEFEAAILEPAGWTAADRRELQARGVQTIAYLSGLEASDAVLAAAQLSRADLLVRSGAPWRRDEFGTWVVDPRSVTWRGYLAARAQELIAAGWDGIFLDTLGDVEEPALAAESGWLVPAAASIVRLLRPACGERLLLLNNGIWSLLPLVAGYLDAVCWEGLPTDPAAWPQWVRDTLGSLAQLHNLYGVTPLVIVGGGEEPAPQFKAGLAARGIAVYIAPGDYTSGVRLPGGGFAPGPQTR